MGNATLRLAVSLLALCLTSAAASEDVQGERARLEREAREAYGRKDYPGFLLKSRRLVELAPGSARGLYNLACAQSLAGLRDQAVASLERIAGMGIRFDAAKDPDLAGLGGMPGFEAVLARMAALDAPVSRSRVAFTLPDRELITEGIAHDPKSGDFFVSSVRKRKVLRISADGRVADFVKEGQDGLLSALALAVDPRRRALYVSSEAMPAMLGLRPEDKGRSFVVEYDVDSGKARRTLTAPSGPAGEAHLGDLGVGPDGTLAVSDPQAGRVYVLGPSDSALRVLVEAGPLVSPQGLAFSPDGRWLFVADYARGIARVDLASGAVSLLPAPADAPVGGIDGLVYARGSLVGIENGYSPHKLVRLRLAEDQSRIVEASVLERANPQFDEPTLGVVVGDELYYVATSQYSKVREDGSLELDELKPPLVLRMPIE